MKNSIENLDTLIAKNKNKLLLIDFFLTNCPPCQQLMPLLEQIKKAKPNLEIIKINGHENFELAKKYNIKYYPSLLLGRQRGLNIK
ncbi:MAG: thioredoxin family protein [Pigeon pea little leaf phytoplasma]|uniref:Thioredoxin family protein n=1 Tax=Candidatus Phytoplasma fabacearum TaxID=2982628 RepID=A0ABU8ZUD7_9MOLU|nr:thioredoxin family protein ['Bituminaria bituminosa' little leaf phytoplasma]MDV3149111.1 thioredoxin family protein [Pigeon pea little leaf phytoplasma]MDO7983713.1 thioredoxin family protein ['Bituminaria bituminosa' little leaf phytoplasma]MDO8023991.1 thioredoxin family protein ['Bituminaria bituminosa' little leaf phytoplasma]MDO8030718.1 thioredoxin family protein ['Bituminaria bituminosa' little leaf phytoplasma]MDV3153965.1 thioredoxin family protein [Pigeon pea little leaf phytopla